MCIRRRIIMSLIYHLPYLRLPHGFHPESTEVGVEQVKQVVCLIMCTATDLCSYAHTAQL